MKILITGGNGFIAKSLVSYFKTLPSYTIFAPSKNELNLSNEKDVDTFFDTHSIDIIIHTANKANTLSSEVVEENLRMFFNIVKHSKKVKKIIHFGSGAEYSKHKPIVDVKEEEALKEQPLDAYGFYKSICSKYIQNSENIINLRLFGCYGELEDYKQKFISNAIVKNLLQEPIIINQNVYFDYLYIDDLIQIIIYFLHNDNKYKIYNASSGKKIDLISLANIINDISDTPSSIIVNNHTLNNEYTSDNSRLLLEIETLSLTSHQVAIKKMYHYFSNTINLIDKKTVFDDNYIKTSNTKWLKGNN